MYIIHNNDYLIVLLDVKKLSNKKVNDYIKAAISSIQKVSEFVYDKKIG